MLPIRKKPAAIDQRFVEYALALTDGVTGQISDLLDVQLLTHSAASQCPSALTSY